MAIVHEGGSMACGLYLIWISGLLTGLPQIVEVLIEIRQSILRHVIGANDAIIVGCRIDAGTVQIQPVKRC